MDFIGSKIKLNEWIFGEIEKVASPADGWFIDAMSGSGAVSRYAAEQGYDVVACDLLAFPQHLVRGSIGIDGSVEDFARLCLRQMKQFSGVEGYFYDNFSEHAGRPYFTDENSKSIDVCRQFVSGVAGENLLLDKFSNKEQGRIMGFRDFATEILEGTPGLYEQLESVLLYSMLEALSRVSNTMGTHGAFKKLQNGGWKDRALKQFDPRMEPLFDGTCDAYNQSFTDFCKTKAYKDLRKSVIYVDPPYNERQYAPNYHLYEALVRYDGVEGRGVTGLRDWSTSKSTLCNADGFLEFLGFLLENSECQHIFVSYSSDGLVSRDEILDYLKNPGVKVVCHDREYKRYKSDNKRTYKNEKLFEYLFHISL